MAYVRWERRPKLRRPTLVAAFEGWNDAGESATTAVRYLARHLGATTIATIDPEEFYDFTVARPHVRLEDGVTRKIDWPTPIFEAATIVGTGRDVILLHSIEPALKWRTFCQEVVDLCQALNVELVLTLGALLAEVPHTRDVTITGAAGSAELAAEFGFTRSRYEGPTGILGILHDACNRAGLRGVSLWATTPHYLRELPSPKAALALVQRAAALLGTSVPTTELEIASTAYERQVDDMLGNDDDLVDYVRRLEEESEDEPDELADSPDLEPIDPDHIAASVDEIERFLRDQTN